jgi:basic amino acid/polyamine antiporter, APA family
MSNKNRVLHRALGPFAAGAFVVTSMIGTGIFTVPAFVRTSTGNGLGSLAVWLVGAVYALSGALCYAELATRLPEAGGEYHYLTRIYGRLSGFLSGWISFIVGFSAAIAASALGAAAYASAVFPQIRAESALFNLYGWTLTHGAVLAALLILALSIFHCTGVHISGKFQTVIAFAVVIAIIAMVLGGFSTGRGDWSGVIASSETSGEWWIALIQVSFAYSGWNAAAYLAGEVVTPRRTLPLALVGGTLTVGAMYLSLNLFFLYAIPGDAWKPQIAVGSLAAERVFGVEGARAISAVVTLIIVGSVSSMVASGPRVYYAMSRDGLAHLIFGRLNVKTGAPIYAILTQASVATLLALTGAFKSLLIYAGAALSLFTALAVAALYVIPRPAKEDDPHIFRAPGYPITPAIYVILTLIAFIQGLRESPIPTGAALVTIALGVGVYYLARSNGWLVETTTEPEIPKITEPVQH